MRQLRVDNPQKTGRRQKTNIQMQNKKQNKTKQANKKTNKKPKPNQTKRKKLGNQDLTKNGGWTHVIAKGKSHSHSTILMVLDNI